MRALLNTALMIIALALLPVFTAIAESGAAEASPKGIGSEGYTWNKMTPERAEALKKTGDAERGRDAFRGCRGCHKLDGFGRVDGLYPKLTGQHASVIIKQVTDIRSGVRSNPKMEPFASADAVSLQELADIAAFLAKETTIKENGKGPGDQVRLGETIYSKNGCIKCHGKQGAGSKEKVYPVVAAQHYSYLLREMELIKLGIRENSHPDMVAAMRNLSPPEMEAVADYLSRLPDYRDTGTKKAGCAQ